MIWLDVADVGLDGDGVGGWNGGIFDSALISATRLCRAAFGAVWRS